MFLIILTNSSFAQQSDSLAMEATGVEATLSFRDIPDLKKSNKGRKITETSILVNDLSDRKAKVNDIFYFGVLTVGNNVDHCLLKNKDDIDIIKVNGNIRNIFY